MKKYAYLPGALMVVAAVLWSAFTLHWGRPAATLGAGGLAALGIGMAANRGAIREWLRDPRGVFVLNSAMSTMLLAAALVLVNAMAGLRATTFDWTEAGRNTLAPETTQILEHLGEDVVLTQFGRTRDPGVGRLLGAFAAGAPRVRLGFVDLDASPQTARRYGVVRAGTVVAESARRFRRIEQLTEPAIATAILQATSPVEPAVCFATGDGEHNLADTGPQGLSGLASVLAASNYAPRAVSLLQSDVPQDCAVLVIAGLPGGLPTDALARVEAYLARGGRIALTLDPSVDPGIAAFVRRLGIAAGQGVIVETSGAGRAVGAGPENPVSFAYHDHPITRGFDQRTIFGQAVPLAVVRTEIGDPKPLVSTADTAFERVDLVSRSTEFREGRDRKGPFLLAVASSIPRGSRDAALPEPRIVVVGDSDFLANGLITWTANRDFAVRIMAWLAGVEEMNVVSVGEHQNRRIPLTEGRRTAMYLVNIGLLPLLPLIAGLVIGIRSRNQRLDVPGAQPPGRR
jgi:hypothetical protein